jgi:spoIIIJ-associated protein
MSSFKSSLTQTTTKLFDLLGVKIEDLKIEVADGEAAVSVKVPEEDSGLLIGYHGDTLTSIQYLLGQIVNKGLENWTRVVVNLNDYRQSRELQLKQMAQNAADRAASTGDEIEMPYLTPAERRIVHLELSSRPDITTYSEGEDRYRRLIVTPKPKVRPTDDSETVEQ